MNSNVYQTLGQVSSEDAGQIFRDHLRGCVRQMISEVMAAEVSELCSPKHKPSGGAYYRAGSSSGSVLVEEDLRKLSSLFFATPISQPQRNSTGLLKVPNQHRQKFGILHRHP